MPFRSVPGRLTLLAAAFAVPTLALAALLILEAHRNERAIVERQLSETSRALSLVVDRQLGQAEATLKALATSPGLASGDLQAFRQQAEAALPDSGQRIILHTQGGQQLLNTALPPGAPLPAWEEPPDFVSSLGRDQLYISNLAQGVARPDHVVWIAAPVTYAGNAEGALSIILPAAALDLILAAQELPTPWIAAIIDRDGTIVARSRRAEEFVGGKATPDIRALVRTRDHAIVESVTLDGVRTLAAFTRSSTSGWSVIIGAPQAELYASAWRLALLAFSVAFVLVVLGALVYWWVARSIVRSVEALAAGAKAVGKGTVPPAASTGLREVDVVANVLQDSARQLLARERDLIRLNETLEARVEERTHELSATVAKLEQANQALEIKNRELQDFAYVASHDLQEPLRKITTFGELIQHEFGEVLEEHGRAYLDRMTGAAARMSQLIAGLLAFSRVQMDGGNFRPIDLGGMVDEVLLDLEVASQEASARVEVGDLPHVTGDPTQIRQLMQNLIGNAIKFRKPGVPPVIHITASPERGASASGGLCTITVEDNGIGFDKKYSDRIFAPFQRLHGRGPYPGTGIGLAICRRIVERHGGTIEALSTPGEGSTFIVSLPCARQGSAAPTSGSEPTPPPQ